MNTKKAKSPLNGSVDLLSKALRAVIVEAVSEDRAEILKHVDASIKRTETALLGSVSDDIDKRDKKIDANARATKYIRGRIDEIYTAVQRPR